VCQVAAHGLVLLGGCEVWLETCNGRCPSYLPEGCLLPWANYYCAMLARLEHVAKS
jgi:hypothetical protein